MKTQTQPSRRRRSVRRRSRRRTAQALPRAKVGQSAESKGSATIHSQLTVMATASRGVKPHTGQPQGVIRESPHAPGSTVAQPNRQSPLPRDNPAVQAPAIGASGTQRRRRRHQETPRYRIGQEKTPLAPKASGETRLWASRCGARAQRRLTSAQPPPRT